MSIEKTEFEFPDEEGTKNARAGSRVVEPESDPDTEIEIVDDTPEKDRHRTPLGEAPKPVTDDELAKYSDQKLKDRLAHMNKGYHEERRAKEVALREREEAVRVAQSVVEENKRLQGSLASNQTALIDQAKMVVASEIEDAKRAYKDAYEAGDSEALTKAQEKLTTASIRADKVHNFKPAPLQTTEYPVQTQQQAPQAPEVDSKTRDWLDKNSWFGTNRKMAAYALILHEELKDTGVPVASDEYYEAIDIDMRKRFPESFADEPADAKTSQRTKSNVVAPASRSTAPRKIVLTQTQVNIAKRLGVPLELYARKVAEEMRK
jgi:rRNA maturation endonuclease Nob1